MRNRKIARGREENGRKLIPKNIKKIKTCNLIFQYITQVRIEEHIALLNLHYIKSTYIKNLNSSL